MARAAAILSLLLLASSASAQTQFFIEPIANALPWTGSPADCSIALDRGELPHVAFGNLSHGVWYSRLSPGGWSAPQLIDDEGGAATGIALDAIGGPHVAYIALVSYNPDVYAIKYARRVNDAWIIETIESGVQLPSMPNTALALDAQDNPHIAYTIRDPSSVRYARKYGGAWTLETVDGPAWGPSLALDSAGRPLIAYMDYRGPVYTLVYAQKVAADWLFEDVGQFGSSCSLALDAADQPHIAFSATYQEILTYASKVGGAWVMETVDPTWNPGHLRTSLALAADGTPHVGATNWTNTAVRYATRTAEGWQIQLLDGSAHDASIDLDNAGRPHIAYTHYAIGPLAVPYYAREANTVEVIGTTSDATLYQNGVDVVHVQVSTRRYFGPAGPVTLTGDLLPTLGPTYHLGEETFFLDIGQGHISEFFWPMPDTSYAWEFDGELTLTDASAPPLQSWLTRVRSWFHGTPLPEAEVQERQQDIDNCFRLTEEERCRLEARAEASPILWTVFRLS